MAASMLICLLASQRSGPMLETSEEARRMAALIVSNDSAPAYLAGSLTHEHNVLTSRPLGWTNTGFAPAGRASQPSLRPAPVQ
jgi:hypothetical protein